jgi:hypothetical protein
MNGDDNLGLPLLAGNPAVLPPFIISANAPEQPSTNAPMHQVIK